MAASRLLVRPILTLVAATSFAIQTAAAQDQDLDGVLDEGDNCVTIANTNQLDGDVDGVGDLCDNCIDRANGPDAQWGLCDDQQDADGDGYGNACDTDVDNNGATDLADVAAVLAAAQAVSTDPLYDFNCDLSTGLDDLAQTFFDSAAVAVVGPSGHACAGTQPCPAGVIGSPLAGEIEDLVALSETEVSGAATTCAFTTPFSSPFALCDQTVLVYPLGVDPSEGPPLVEFPVSKGADLDWLAAGLASNRLYGFFLRNHVPFGTEPKTTTAPVIHHATHGPPPPVLPNPPLVPSGPLVGTTRGQFEVSAAGSTTYTIPLVVVPGTRGVEPDLSLRYSSNNSRNGLLGVGWNLEGLPQIQRCPQSLVLDGAVSSVQYEERDRFCLGGQRLVPADGSYTSYGGDGKEYRTEIESFSKVVSHGASGSGPAWFEVWTRDGRRLELGKTPNSAIEGEGKSEIAVWVVSRVEDKSGNYMTFSYLEDGVGGSFRPESIDYTGNDDESPPRAPFAHVQFAYEARSDVPVRFHGGSRESASERLWRIRTFYGSGLVREYRLAYDDETQTRTGRSRLGSVTECGSDGVSCLPPTTFDWQDPSPTISFLSQQNPASDDLEISLPEQYPPISGDFDGDGIADVLWPTWWYGTGWEYRVWWGKVEGGFDFQRYYEEVGVYAGVNNGVGDFNGDGRTDVSWYSPGKPQIWYGNADRTFTYDVAVAGLEAGHSLDWKRLPGDFNGDGMTDLFLWHEFAREVWYATNSGATTPLPGNPSPDGNWMQQLDVAGLDGTSIRHDEADHFEAILGDFDADGATEILLYWADQEGRTQVLTGLSVLNQRDDGTFEQADVVAVHDPLSPGAPAGSVLHAGALPRTGDFNGDGATDILWFTAQDNRLTDDGDDGYRWLWLSKATDGDVEFSVISNLGGVDATSAYAGNSLATGDFNGDGLDDVHWYRHGSGVSRVWISRGNGSFADHYNGAGFAFTGYRVVDDFNGDGTDEILWWRQGDSNYIDTFLWRHADPLFPDLLRKITDGLGAETDVDYRPLCAQDDYDELEVPLGPTPPWKSLYPLRNIPPRQWVVDAVHFDDGLEDTDGPGPEGTYTFDYAYEGVRTHLERRLFLGFHAVTATDSRDGQQVRRVYSQEFPFEGKITQRVDFTAAGGIMREEDLAWSERTLESAQSHLVFLEQATVREWEYPDPVAPTGLRRKVTTYNEFDDAGNHTLRRTTTTSDPQDLETHVEEVVSTFYPPDPITWLISLPSSETVTRTAPDLSTDSLATVFDFDLVTGLENYRITGQGTDTWLFPHVTARDGSGNVTTLLLNGSAMVARTTLSQFDATGRFLETVTNPEGHVSHETRNPGTGELETATDPNGLIAKFGYDALGREVWRGDPDGTVTTTEYLACQEPSSCPFTTPLAMRETRDGQSPLTTYYDELQRPIAVESFGFFGWLIRSETRYDTFGRVTDSIRPHFASGPPPEPVHTEYDHIGRPELVHVPGAHDTTIAYDVVGDRSRRTSTQGTGPEARVTVEDRDATGRVVRVLDAEEGETTYEYDAFGSLRKTTDHHGNDYFQTMDRWGRLRSIEDPDRGSWQFDYDAVGNLIEQMDAKLQVVTLTYDGLDRPIIRNELGGITTWTYDTGVGAVGRLVAAEVPGYRRAYHYDALGRLSWHETEISGRRFGFAQTYDAHSRPEHAHYASAISTTSTYAASGQLERVEDAASGDPFWRSWGYDATGRPDQVALGAPSAQQVLVARSYDPLTNLPSSILVASGSGGAQFGYTYDSYLDPWTRTADDPANSSRSETFEHDRLGRLVSSWVAGGVEVLYDYDGIGNLVSRSDMPALHFEGTGPHQLTGVGGASLSYDTNGALESDGMRNITWASFHKPIQIDAATGVSKTYRYGPDREIVHETTTGAQTAELYRLDDTYELEISGGTSSQERTWIAVPAGVSILVTTTSLETEATYSVNDPLDSPLVRFDASGTALDYLSFSPFGEFRSPDWVAPAPAPADSWDHYFTGQQLDAEIGYYNYGARHYDSAIGVFISPDPAMARAGAPAELNPYAYVQNRPLSLVDPSGATSEYSDDYWFSTWSFDSFETLSFDRGPEHSSFDSSAFSSFDSSFGSLGTFDATSNFAEFSFVGTDLLGSASWLQQESAFNDFGFRGGADFQEGQFGGANTSSGGFADSLFVLPPGIRGSELDARSQSVAGTFGVPVVPGAASVRTELFIAAESTLGGRLAGDARGFDAAPNPSRSRAFFTLDFESGAGAFQINPTCAGGGGSCTSALPIGAGNTFDTSITGNSITVTGSLNNSKIPGPSIDFGITFNASSGGVTFSGYRNAYPSYEITRGSTFLYRGAETHPLRLFDATGFVRFSGP